ncbi:hypothetical protein FOL47_003390 [Perkinsus chesapeaki]|uniref:Uncharacterized protein n=1 Tax=Perkinsus chesapeaki TaxID=330153 RepID=A0A7J6M9U2_PERCH|nr:hypothetical protein FOL47_003390 [Perkinsus chesapeaki]
MVNSVTARLSGEKTVSEKTAVFTSKDVEKYIAPQPFTSFMKLGGSSSTSPVMDWIDSSIAGLKSWAGSELLSWGKTIIDTLGDHVEGADMYYNFIPRHVATLENGGKWHNFEGRCFKDIKVRSTKQDDGTTKIEADYQNAVSWTCAEYVLFGNAADFQMQYKIHRGTESYTWSADDSKIHVLDLRTSLTDAAEGIIKTADLLLGREHVLDFLNHFMGVTLNKRPNPGGVDITEENIHPGDAVLVTNIQGQSATIMWGSGSMASHTLMFLREPETQELYTVESWAGGVRKLPFQDFLKDDAGWYNNAVLVPLKEELRESFDNDAAWKKFTSDFEGNDYGYSNFLFTTIDTLKGNYPCMPMDNYQTCLSWEFIEIGLGLVERSRPDMAQLIFLEAFNHRMGTSELGLNDLLKLADSKLEGGAAMLPVIPENDEWTYHTHHNGQPIVGPSRVCSALACELLRAGGVLGDHALSCSEFTPWDIYSMDIFTTPTFQLKGDYAIDLTLPHALPLGQKPVTDDMAETCATIITDDSFYARAPHC